MPNKPTVRRLLIATACGAAILPIAASAGARAEGGPTTITFQEDRPAIEVLHLRGTKGDDVRLGDRFVGTGGLFDSEKKKLGKVGFDCAVLERSPKKFFLAQLHCTVTYVTAQGQIVAAGFYRLDGSQQMPVVGGSGAYAGARGTLGASKPLKGFDAADEITLLP